jgi:para-nitrobenzyl esterase
VFSTPRPPEVKPTPNPMADKFPKPMVGASHASEIEFAMGNLQYDKVFAWTDDQYKVSNTMENYFANFIKTGNPNGKSLPKWDANTKGSVVKFMNIDISTKLQPETDHDRYLFLDKQYTEKK